VLVTDEVLDDLDTLVPLAPLHQPHNLKAIRFLREYMPRLPQVACFDTAFHATQPNVAQAYALPRDITGAGVRRYGFHGLSYEYIASQLPRVLGDRAHGKVVVAHLGSGASLCALIDGKSVASTMGFSALDGLMMGTRCGALDPGVVLYMMQALHMTPEEVSDLLYNRSGLLGVSGISNDMQVLLASTDPRAVNAVDLFVHRIVCEIGSLAAAMGGLDALVFTAGIGENAAPIRSRVSRACEWLGALIDEEANYNRRELIHAPSSRLQLVVMATDEEKMIATKTLRCANRAPAIAVARAPLPPALAIAARRSAAATATNRI
jgi:acetate kinase